MYGYVWLSKAMKDYVRLYTLLLVTNVEPLYDAYTTYLSKQGSVGRSAQSRGLIKPGLGHSYLRIFHLRPGTISSTDHGRTR